MDWLSSQESVLPKDWLEVLERIQQALTHALEDATQRERAVDPIPESTNAATPQPNLEQVDQWMLAFQSCFQQAEWDAAEVEAALEEGQDSLQRWLTAAELFRQRLGKWTASSI
jgi:hypothetical protein